MNRILSIMAIVGLLTIETTTACSNGSQTSSVPTSSAASTSTAVEDMNIMSFLVSAGDAVELKRKGWADYIPVAFGTRLRWGDLVRVKDKAQVSIVCADLSIQSLTAGYLGGLPCPKAAPVLLWKESPLLNPRGSALPLYPIVLSPRATVLSDPHPLLRWSPAASGIVTYTVTVRGQGLKWYTQTLQTTIRYPTDAPLLRSGGDGYTLVVEANGHSSDEEGNIFRGFTLLDDAGIKEIRNYEQRIIGLGVSDAARRYLMAQMYTSHALRADAIAILETLASEVNTPAIWNALADQYLAVGLYDPAANAYKTAQTCAELTRDILSYAQAELGLGQSYRGMNDTATARLHAQRSYELFQSLNDEVGIAQSEKLLRELEAP